LDERSQSALITIVEWLQRNTKGLKGIKVVGHSGRTGSRRARRAISLARAETIRDKLVSYGVPANLIVVQALGDAAPAVATADGVPEPDNRRTEIHIEMSDAWVAEQQSRPSPPVGTITTC
jgi:outer membrane protein OmpA-like peptidoglycan-associated protein